MDGSDDDPGKGVNGSEDALLAYLHYTQDRGCPTSYAFSPVKSACGPGQRASGGSGCSLLLLFARVRAREGDPVSFTSPGEGTP